MDGLRKVAPGVLILIKLPGQISRAWKIGVHDHITVAQHARRFGLLFTYCLEKITRASNMRLAYFDQKLVYFNTWNPPLPNRTNPCSVAAILRKHRSAGKRCRLTVNHSLRSLLNRSFVTISFRKLCFAASQIINRFANGPPHSRRFKAVQPIRSAFSLPKKRPPAFTGSRSGFQTLEAVG